MTRQARLERVRLARRLTAIAVAHDAEARLLHAQAVAGRNPYVRKAAEQLLVVAGDIRRSAALHRQDADR